jgi:TonB family protein
METKKKTKKNKINLIIFGIVGTMVLIIAVSIVSLLMSEDRTKQVRRIQQVNLLKPPPPPEKIEKPPEPEMKKKEIIEQKPDDLPPDEPEDTLSETDTQSLDDLLGLDADGSGGADGFGLKAKKGANALIGSGGSRYGMYTRMIQKEISDIVRRFLEEKGDLPDGTFKTEVKIQIDDEGKIVNYSLLASSGDKAVDHAVASALSTATFKEMPPLNMPRILKFRITTRGKA